MLRWRLFGAAILVLPLLLLLAVDLRFSGPAPGIWLAPVGLAAALLAGAEVVQLVEGQARLQRWAILTGIAGIYVSNYVPILWAFSGEPYPADCPLGRLGWPLTATLVGWLTLFILEMLRFRQPGQHILRVAMGTFILVYIGLLFSYLPQLRAFADNRTGMVALLSVLLIVKMSDTGAYATGRLLGRHPLAPLLSPRKTVEGAVGGVAFAALVAAIYFQWVAPWILGEPLALSVASSVLYGIILALAGIVGDLGESLIKRDRQQKDSSSWLPGLGGVLDIVDSVLVATPAAYLCWSLGLVG